MPKKSPAQKKAQAKFKKVVKIAKKAYAKSKTNKKFSTFVKEAYKKV